MTIALPSAEIPVVLLAGGKGTRLAEETDIKPKPMVEIGDRPILWHIMKHYARYGFRNFYIALGYKGSLIKRYFVDEVRLAGDLIVSSANRNVEAVNGHTDDWTVHLCDTGAETATGGRVKRLSRALAGGTFMVTYGDGVSNVPLDKLLAFHRRQGKLATLTAVRPPARYGGIVFDGDRVAEFVEKPQLGEGWINGGFLVFEAKVLDYLQGDNASLEATLLEQLAREGELAAYRHDGFWQCMDTLRDVRLLQQLWNTPSPPWRTWTD